MKYRSSLKFSGLLLVLQQRSKLQRSRQLCASLNRQIYDFHLNCTSDLQSVVKAKFKPGATVNIKKTQRSIYELAAPRSIEIKYSYITSNLISSLLPTLKQCLLNSWRHMAWLFCLCKDHSAFPWWWVIDSTAQHNGFLSWVWPQWAEDCPEL